MANAPSSGPGPDPTKGLPMKLTRPLAAAAAAALTLTLTACGGDDGSAAPENASVEDFCDAYTGLLEDLVGDIDLSDPSSIETPSPDEAVEAIQDWASDLAETGTPEDMPDEARAAFEAFVDGAQDINADDLEDPADIGALEEEFGISSEENEALTAYITENCGGELMEDMPEMPDMSDLPTDLPTDLPSDLPTDLPTEIPSDLLSDLPTELLSDLPTELLTEVPTQ